MGNEGEPPVERAQLRTMAQCPACAVSQDVEGEGFVVCQTCGAVSERRERQDYETPPELFASLSKEFGPFDLDVAANETNHKTPRWFGRNGEHADALNGATWGGRCWMNPPYGRQTAAFVKRASEASALVVCLLPARTDTRWFHDFILPKAKVVRFLKGRPKFWLDGKPTGSAGKFPSMVVVFDGRE